MESGEDRSHERGRTTDCIVSSTNTSTWTFTQEDPIGLAGGLNLYGFANGDPVDFSDPFGLCTQADGWTDCDRMVSRSQGMGVVQEAKNSGEWMYSQGQEGEAAVSYTDRVGDCTDYVRNGVQEGLGDAWSGGAKASTRMFWNGQAAGFTEVEAAAAQPGDIVVSGPGEHAGVFTGVNSKGEIRALANNGSPTSSKSGYRDGDTKVTTFAPGSRFYRPLSGQMP